jgi:hypothetical protein
MRALTVKSSADSQIDTHTSVVAAYIITPLTTLAFPGRAVE